MQVVKGYKVTDSNMRCRGYQYEINKEFTHAGSVRPCDSGFHFCEQAADCFDYYSFDRSNRVFEVEGSGVLLKDGNKNACSVIKFIRELTWEEVLKIVNTGVDNTGHRNSGHRNSGHRNSGHSNSGDSNSGDSNSGDSNSGDSNSGDRNSGYSNSGDSNSGHRNSGDSNSGHRNSGHSNSGDRNSGDWNSGDWNSGDSNSGDRNAGVFCAEKDPKIFLFDKPSDWTWSDWQTSAARRIMGSHLSFSTWIWESEMTDAEKEENPSHKTTGGYLKNISVHEGWANMWHNLTDDNKKAFTSLPNFDKKIFKQITGIKL